MNDIYTGPDPGEGSGSSGANKVNEIVYRNMALLLRKHQPARILNPNSALGQDAHARLSAMSEHGVDLGRLATVSSIAHTHHQREIEVDQAMEEDAAQSELAELAELMEEAPGA